MGSRTPQISTKIKPARIEGVAEEVEIEAEVRGEEDKAVIKATTEVNGRGKTAPPRVGTAALPRNVIATDLAAKPAT